MKKTIFISSTFQDLKSHRDQLWKVLLNFDINVTGMEEFGARKSTSLETCLKEIQESDIYIGVVSMCYGSVDEITGKSYTQLEYEAAKANGLEILIYLIDENIGEVKVGHIDFGDKSLRLTSFKRILKSNHTVDFFVNEIDLGQKVYRRLEKLIPRPGQLATRPKSLEAKVEFIDLEESSWALFIGYLNGKPFEIFTALVNDIDGVLIPRSIHSGLINKETFRGDTRFDFQYQNKHGYRTTIEGINYTSNRQIQIFDKIVSNLLQCNVHLEVVIETLKQMDTEEKEYKYWNNYIIDILRK
jgi:hypothetical protein